MFKVMSVRFIARTLPFSIDRQLRRWCFWYACPRVSLVLIKVDDVEDWYTHSCINSQILVRRYILSVHKNFRSQLCPPYWTQLFTNRVMSALRHFCGCYLKANKLSKMKGQWKLDKHIFFESVVIFFAKNIKINLWLSKQHLAKS